jgi:tetratricopeptide (TPR) repeat protein
MSNESAQPDKSKSPRVSIFDSLDTIPGLAYPPEQDSQPVDSKPAEEPALEELETATPELTAPVPVETPEPTTAPTAVLGKLPTTKETSSLSKKVAIFLITGALLGSGYLLYYLTKDGNLLHQVSEITGESPENKADRNEKLDSALVETPLTPPNVPFPFPETGLELAEIYLDQEDYPAAEKLLTELIEKDPESSKAHFYRGLAELGSGKYTNAIEDFTAAINLGRSSADSFYHRAMAYLQRGRDYQETGDEDDLEKVKKDFIAAMADFKEATRRESSIADAWFQRGLLHRDNKENDEAVLDFSSFVDAEPEEPLRFFPDWQGKIYEAHFQRGMLYWKATGQPDEARSDFDIAITLVPLKIAPLKPHYWEARAELRQEAEPEDAVLDYEMAIKLRIDQAGL